MADGQSHFGAFDRLPMQRTMSPQRCAASSDARAHSRHSGGMTPRGDLRDIETRDDCERLARAFYGRALDDPIIGWIFVDVARLDLEAHVPTIASFWETILLGAQSYSGGAFRPHAELHRRVELRPGHFERWLALWSTTVDELFAGPRAELAKAHARRVAHAFARRLRELPSARDLSAAPAGLSVTLHGSAPDPGSGR